MPAPPDVPEVRRPGPSRLTALLAVALLVLAGCSALPGGAPPTDGPRAPATGTPASTPPSTTTTPNESVGTPSELEDVPVCPTRHAATGEGTPVPDPPTKEDIPPGLTSDLFCLSWTDHEEWYASRKGIELRDGRVEVVTELQAGRTLPEEFDVDVEARADGTVDGWVPIDRLRALAAHPNVTYVRRPYPILPAERTTG